MCFGLLSLGRRTRIEAALYPAALQDAGLLPPLEARTRALAGKSCRHVPTETGRGLDVPDAKDSAGDRDRHATGVGRGVLGTGERVCMCVH